MRNIPKLPACRLTVQDPIHMWINRGANAQFYENPSDRPDSLYPLALAWVSGSCGASSPSRASAMAIGALGNLQARSSPAHSLYLVGCYRPRLDKSSDVIPGDGILDIRKTFGIEPDTIGTTFKD
jgi:hypothetical protein